MKSKRSEEYIDDNIYDAAECVDRDGCGWAVVKRIDADLAVELAEEEMIEKAVRVFCEVVCADRSFPCIGEASCKKFNEFKQKLM